MIWGLRNIFNRFGGHIILYYIQSHKYLSYNAQLSVKSLKGYLQFDALFRQSFLLLFSFGTLNF